MLGLKIVKHPYIGHFSVKLLGLCKNHKIITPPQLRSPLPFDWRGAGYHCCLTWLPTPRRGNFTSLFRLPTPRRGGVLARGAGCKNTATKQFIPMLGTLYSHVGNSHHQCLMLANQILLDVSLQAIQRVSTTDLPDPTDFFIRVQVFL